MILPVERYCTVTCAWKNVPASALAQNQGGYLAAILVQQGRCRAKDYGRAVVAQEGDMLLLRMPFSLLPDDENLTLGVALGGMAAQEAAHGLSKDVLSLNATPAIKDLMERLAQERHTLSPANESALAYTLLCCLADIPQDIGEASPALSPLVQAAVDAMQAHYGEVYGIEELAASLGVSKSHLIRCFSADMGVPPGRHLTMVRLKAVQNLLLHSDLSLEMIAGTCGFSGANYLCRLFKKEIGQPPGTWRRQNRVSEEVRQDDFISDHLYL